jgi:putative redox protein
MEMKVQIRRQDDHLHFEGVNGFGNTVSIDGGDHKKGMRPMELLLTALGSCSAFDAVHILQRQRQQVDDFEVEVTGTRPDDGNPKPYETIHLIFRITGKVERKKAERAISLAMEKYCSVSATFRKETKITYALELKAS